MMHGSQALLQAAKRKVSAIASNAITMRSITVGTDMISSVISLQKARPWYMSDAEGSNMADDNAVTLKDLFEKQTVALFGVPAPFTGTCSNEHYPGYKALADDFLQAGVDRIVCYSVADPYAMDGWAKALKNDAEKITFMADPDSLFAKAYGLDAAYDAVSLGQRSIRFSMVVADGKVEAFHKVDDAVKDAETLLADVKEWKDHQ
jgi:peroxiredoxin